jgi:hypothetical protein
MESIVDQILENIAKEKLLIETLQTRGSDKLDFSQQSVWAIKEALEEAFDAGFKMCRQARG